MTTTLAEPPQILIVEPDEGTIATYARVLSLQSYTVRKARSAEAGWREVEARRPDAMLVAFHLPDLTGLEFLRRLRASRPHRHTPIAIVTGDYSLPEPVSRQLRQLEAELCFKPI
jgi:two-component system sensor histidine kinase UhpB